MSITAQEIADEIIHFKKQSYTDYQGLVIQIEEIQQSGLAGRIPDIGQLFASAHGIDEAAFADIASASQNNFRQCRIRP